MVSDCLYEGGVLMGDMDLLKTKLTLPMFARWIKKWGGDKPENILLDAGIKVPVTEGSQPYVKVPLWKFLNLSVDEVTMDTEKPREDRRFTKVNDFVLCMSKSEWKNPVESDSFEPSMEKVAKALIIEYVETGRLWGLKDPRTLFTLNFWERIFASMGINIKVVFIYRNPNSVAKGLAFQGGSEPVPGWSLEKGLEVWKAYNRQLLMLLNKPFDKILLKYEEFMRGDDEFHRLERFLGMEGQLKNPFDHS
ncbi:MAG: hypothetical protein GF307_14170, partial [candidate division Zixibacteria bacterium]|nr:hypothetical protein [candidate division Zixibacteria bacterium]